MKYWPVRSVNRNVPRNGPGSFFEYRGDRYHCGIDIYSQKDKLVVACEDLKIIEIGKFTSPEIIPYWNDSYYAIGINNDGLYFRYAELAFLFARERQEIKGNESIGLIGEVLNYKKINYNSPSYIQDLKKKKHGCMLHFEMWDRKPLVYSEYLGGNWFGEERPEGLLDPSEYLSSILK
ncbi:M23 family peptidase [Nanoarchaeota archaeon]